MAAIVDPNRSVPLDSVGGSGLSAVVAVDSDGCEHLGVVHRAAHGNPASGFSRAVPDHEHEGAWPIPEPSKSTDQGTDGLGRRVMRWPK